MVGSKNCNDHRNHGGDLVEVEFNAVHVRFTPETGNRLSAFRRPLSAKSGHCLTNARCTRRAKTSSTFAATPNDAAVAAARLR